MARTRINAAGSERLGLGNRHELFLAATIVVVGVVARISLQHLPNFAPVAAIALFSGYFFRRWAMAAAIPLVVMVLSDSVIGGYDWRMMAVVYGMLTAPVALRRWARGTQTSGGDRNEWQATGGRFGSFLGAGLCGSIAFFVVTNFGSFIWFGSYERSWSGLTTCYLQAIPFFRYTLVGDLFFGVALFGPTLVLEQLAARRRSRHTPSAVRVN